MKSISSNSLKELFIESLNQTRQVTWQLFEQIETSLFSPQAHPDFSPIGWHWGHIAFTEDLWIRQRLAGRSPIYPEYRQLFAADGLPKEQRQNLPHGELLRSYLEDVRAETLKYLAIAPLAQQQRLWWWLIQHEGQHCETIALINQLHRQTPAKTEQIATDLGQSQSSLSNPGQMVKVAAGEFPMGSDTASALDNERPSHTVYLDDYWIDAYPVTCAQYSDFIAAGGYQNPYYWSSSGWRWLQQNLARSPLQKPLYWHISQPNHPVCGVSYYEAEAYANFRGKRLPTEAEWEKAAAGASQTGNHSFCQPGTTPVNKDSHASQHGCYDMLGNVWEWTASWFTPYQDFQFYPYRGYSATYFDGQHRVLRGGSWATNVTSLRTSFRNWYQPSVRQILAGFRCAKS